MSAGLAGAAQNRAPSVEKAETTVQTLNRVVGERHASLMSLCNRLESFADRLEPQPRNATAESVKGPPIQNDLQGVNIRLAGLGETIDWLSEICNRLDHIA